MVALVASTNGLDGPPEPMAKNFWTARMKAAMRAVVSPGWVKLGSQVGIGRKEIGPLLRGHRRQRATVVGEPSAGLATIASPRAPVNGCRQHGALSQRAQHEVEEGAGGCAV